MPELLAPLAVSLMIFFCTFAAAVSGMVLRKKLPGDHLSEDSKDVIKLVMGLIATMAALAFGLLIASANSSYKGRNRHESAFPLSARFVRISGIMERARDARGKPVNAFVVKALRRNRSGCFSTFRKKLFETTVMELKRNIVV